MSDNSFGVILFCLDKGVFRFLLVWENWGEGHWGFPKGHPEENEEPKETALRELLEETGLIPEEVFSNHPDVYHEYSFVHNGETINRRIGYFIAFIEGDSEVKLQREEVSIFRWTTLEEFLQESPYPELQKVVITAQEFVDGIL